MAIMSTLMQSYQCTLQTFESLYNVYEPSTHVHPLWDYSTGLPMLCICILFYLIFNANISPPGGGFMVYRFTGSMVVHLQPHICSCETIGFHTNIQNNPSGGHNFLSLKGKCFECVMRKWVLGVLECCEAEQQSASLCRHANTTVSLESLLGLWFFSPLAVLFREHHSEFTT